MRARMTFVEEVDRKVHPCRTSIVIPPARASLRGSPDRDAAARKHLRFQCDSYQWTARSVKEAIVDLSFDVKHGRRILPLPSAVGGWIWNRRDCGFYGFCGERTARADRGSIIDSSVSPMLSLPLMMNFGIFFAVGGAPITIKALDTLPDPGS